MARAWRLAAGPASPQTLGIAKQSVQCFSRVSVYRRELNRHDSESRANNVKWFGRLRPQVPVVSQTPGICLIYQALSSVEGQKLPGTAVAEPSFHCAAPKVFSQFVGPPFSLAASSVTLLQRLEYFVACHRPQRGAGSF